MNKQTKKVFSIIVLFSLLFSILSTYADVTGAKTKISNMQHSSTPSGDFGYILSNIFDSAQKLKPDFYDKLTESQVEGFVGNDVGANHVPKGNGTKLLNSSIYDNGNVGIGTTNPGSYKLNVNGTLNATTLYENGVAIGSKYLGKNAKAVDSDKLDGHDSSYFQRDITGSCPAGQSVKSVNADGSLVCGNGGADNLGNHTATQNIKLNNHYLSNDGGNEGIRIDNSGNIGIGTTSPSQKLTVAGNIAINNNNTQLQEGAGNALRMRTNHGYVDIGPMNGSYTHLSTDRPKFYFNKGIVVDEGKVSSYNEDLSLQTGGNTKVTIKNGNGNVGIGTTSPSEKLSVAGRISTTTDPNSGDDVGDRDYNDARYINVGESGDSIQDNTIDSSEIQDNSLTASDLAANSVGTSEIADNTVSSTDILNNTITETDISDSFKARDADKLDGKDSTDFLKGTNDKLIVINGNANTYYPVVFNTDGIGQNVRRRIQIFRSYSEFAPSSWHNSTHKGGLVMDFEVNFGGRGGVVYTRTLNEFRETYSTMVSDWNLESHGNQFVVRLRGGGANYHFSANYILSGPTVYYSTYKGSYGDGNIAPKTTLNQANINRYKIFKRGDSGDYIADNTIDSSEIQDNSLTASDLAANSVGNSELIDNPTVSTIYASNWFRSTGASGWYNNTYGGGWYMADSSWIRSYGNKNIYINKMLRADDGFQVDGVQVIGADAWVEGDRIRQGTIDSSEIQDNSLTASDLAANSVGTSEIADNTVSSTDILNNTITEADISDSFKARDADKLDGENSSRYTKSGNYYSYDFNNLTDSSRVTSISSTAHSPFGNARYTVYNARHRGGEGDGYKRGSQIAIGMTNYTNRMAFRNQSNGTWQGWNEVQNRVTGSCPAGQSIRAIASNGTVTCEVDTNTNLSQSTVETYIANDVSTNYVPRDNGTKLVTGTIYDNGTNIGIGTSNPSQKLTLNGNIGRTSHSNGYFVGSYNNVGSNDRKTNPIYTIGNNYKPSDTSLGNMYGIGYSHSNFWGTSSNKPSGWGQYVAADGDIRVILEASSGRVRAASDVRAPRFYDTNNTSYYVDPASTSYVNDLRANIIYDRQNTGYYVDPASNSKLNNLVLNGNLTVNGTETKINSTNMYVKDRNIHINNGGDNNSSDTAGLTVEDGIANGNTSAITWNKAGKYFQIKDGTGTHRITTENIDTNTDTQNLGTSGNSITLTNGGSVVAPYANNSNKLDGLDSSQFLRSDQDDDTSGRIRMVNTSNGQSYNKAPLEILQSWNSGNGEAPHIGFHYSGAVASQIGFMKGDSSGDISILDNPGTGYETLRARDYKVGTTQVINSSKGIQNISKLSFDQGSNYRIDTNSAGLLFDGGDGARDFLVYDERAYVDNITMGYAGSATLSTYDSNENLIIDPNGAGSVGIATTPGGNFSNGKAIAIGDSDTGIRQDGDGVLELWTNNVERVHVANNGNVGIGTGSPSRKLDVRGNMLLDNGTSTNLTIKADDGGNAELNLMGDSQSTGRLFVGQSSSYGGGIEYNGDNSPSTSGAGSDNITLYRRSSGTNYRTARNYYNSNDWEFRGSLRANGNITSSRYYDRDNTSYYVDPASTSYVNDLRANIIYDRQNTGYYVNPDGSSNLNSLRTQGNMTVDRDLYVGENGAGTSDQYFYDDNSNTWRGIRWNDSANYFELEDNNGNYHRITTEDIDTVGSGGDNLGNHTATTDLNMNSKNINSVNDITAIRFLYHSDRRLKKNIKPLDSSLEKINKLEGVSFNWRKDGTKDIGVIAQDVEKVYPDLVNTDKNTGLKSVKYGNLVSPIIEAIKELTGKFEDLFNKYLDQQKQIDSLEQRLERLEKLVN